MNKFIKNILLLVVVLALSYFTADYFGSWYDKFSPQYGGSWFNFPKSIAVFIAGIFTLFGFGNRKKWLIWLLIPPLLLWISADRYYIYLPTILALIAFGLAILLRKIFKISQ